MIMKTLPCSNCFHNKICNRKDELEAIGNNILKDYKDELDWVTITISCDEYRSDFSSFKRDDYFS